LDTSIHLSEPAGMVIHFLARPSPLEWSNSVPIRDCQDGAAVRGTPIPTDRSTFSVIHTLVALVFPTTTTFSLCHELVCIPSQVPLTRRSLTPPLLNIRTKVLLPVITA